MKIRTNFTFRIDTWTADGESIVEHLAASSHFAFRVDIWDDTGDSIVEHIQRAIWYARLRRGRRQSQAISRVL